MRIAVCLLLALLLPRPSMASGDTARPDPVAEFVRQGVLAALASEGHRATVSVLGERSLSRTAPAFAGLKLRPLTGRWPRPRVAASVELLDAQQQPIAVRTVWLAVDIPTKAWVYAHSGHPGEPLNESSLVSRQVNLANIAGAPLTTAESTHGLQLRCAVRAGEVALSQHFEAVPDLHRNDAVTLTVDSGAVRLQTAATALESGRIGDVVSVRAANAIDSVHARIISNRLVQLVR